MTDITDIPTPYMRCSRCGRKVPVRNQKLVRHYIFGPVRRKLFRLVLGESAAVCASSGTIARAHSNEDIF